MKNIILFLTLLLSIHAFSQESYPHRRPQLMLGKQVKVLPISEKMRSITPGYENFYSDAEAFDEYKTIPGRIETKPEALEGRTFTITDVQEKKGYDSDSPKDYYYIYTLEDVNTKEVLYYMFSPRYDWSKVYYLEVIGGLDLPDDFYCDYVETMVVREGSVYHSVERKFECKIEKHYYDGKVNYQLRLQIAAVNFPGKGYTVTLENGSVIACSGICTIREDGYQRRIALRDLTENEMKLLSQYKIISFTIQGTEYKLSEQNMTIMKEGAKCLLTK